MGFIGFVFKFGAVITGLIAVFLGLLTSGHLAEFGLFNHVPDMFKGIVPVSLTMEFRANAWTFTDMPDLSGTVSLVTGANIGLGYYTALHLANKGSKVIMGCRNMEKCNTAAKNIKSEAGGKVDVIPMKVDLGSLSSVQDFAAEVNSKFDRLDIVVFNAGFWNLFDIKYSEDGVESTFAVNHIGHFKLFKDLRSLIETTAETSPVKIVSVTSSAHFEGAPEVGIYTTLAEINGADKFDGMQWYGMSKLANVLFANEIADQMEGKNVFCNSAHPGLVNSGFLTDTIATVKGIAHPVVSQLFVAFTDVMKKNLMWTSEDGALTQVYLAAASEVETKDIRGKYFHPIAMEINPSEFATEKNQKDLWRFSEQLLSEKGF